MIDDDREEAFERLVTLMKSGEFKKKYQWRAMSDVFIYVPHVRYEKRIKRIASEMVTDCHSIYVSAPSFLAIKGLSLSAVLSPPVHTLTRSQKEEFDRAIEYATILVRDKLVTY